MSDENKPEEIKVRNTKPLIAFSIVIVLLSIFFAVVVLMKSVKSTKEYDASLSSYLYEISSEKEAAEEMSNILDMSGVEYDIYMEERAKEEGYGNQGETVIIDDAYGETES